MNLVSHTRSKGLGGENLQIYYYFLTFRSHPQILDVTVPAEDKNVPVRGALPTLKYEK